METVRTVYSHAESIRMKPKTHEITIKMKG
jgi:hypothetical protein